MFATFLLFMPLIAFLQSAPSSPTRALQPRAPVPMQRTLADAPPFPGTNDPGEILANIQHAIRQIGLNKDSASHEAMLHAPRLRRLLDVTSERWDDYYVVELADPAGKLIGIVGMRKNGKLYTSWGAEGTTPFRSVPDLPPVSRALSARFNASRSYYYHPMPTNIPAASNPLLPLIAADTPGGRVLVDTDFNVYREGSVVPSRMANDQSGRPHFPQDTAPERGFWTGTKTGEFRTLQLVGNIRAEVGK
jgi:hypothetical protein